MQIIYKLLLYLATQDTYVHKISVLDSPPSVQLQDTRLQTGLESDDLSLQVAWL